MKKLILICGLLGFALGTSSSSHPAKAAYSGGSVSVVTATPTCPGGSPPVCARCNSSGGCSWSCYGGYYCTMGPNWCANGVDCMTY